MPSVRARLKIQNEQINALTRRVGQLEQALAHLKQTQDGQIQDMAYRVGDLERALANLELEQGRHERQLERTQQVVALDIGADEVPEEDK